MSSASSSRDHSDSASGTATSVAASSDVDLLLHCNERQLQAVFLSFAGPLAHDRGSAVRPANESSLNASSRQSNVPSAGFMVSSPALAQGLQFGSLGRFGADSSSPPMSSG